MAYPGTDVRRGSDWPTYWDVLGSVAWIESNCFKRVTLQFPDELLAESTLVAAAIQHECAIRQMSTQVSGQLSGSNNIYNRKQWSGYLQVSVLADTSYNSLSVDEVAAQHAQADCVVSLLAASAAYAGCLGLSE